MKKIIIAFFLVSLASCEDLEFTYCTCYLVLYENNVEIFRSAWDNDTCQGEVMDEITYTYSDGTKHYTRTEIQCVSNRPNPPRVQ